MTTRGGYLHPHVKVALLGDSGSSDNSAVLLGESSFGDNENLCPS